MRTITALNYSLKVGDHKMPNLKTTAGNAPRFWKKIMYRRAARKGVNTLANFANDKCEAAPRIITYCPRWDGSIK